MKVTLYPFVMMDIPADNALADPYGKAAQATYPWRGRISCHPAPLQPASADRTAAAADADRRLLWNRTGRELYDGRGSQSLSMASRVTGAIAGSSSISRIWPLQPAVSTRFSSVLNCAA